MPILRLRSPLVRVFRTLALSVAAMSIVCSSARATENGASPYPVGVETVLTGLQPHPGKTIFYEYTCFYAANEMVDGNGKKIPIDFKVRVFATALKLNHTWKVRALGGNVYSYIAAPLIYQQLRLPIGRATKYAVGNVDLVPFGISYHKGMAHWYYEADFFMPGTGYSKNDFLNIGQHYFSAGPTFGVTLLPNNGKTEISLRTSYLINGYDKDTHYHSGNEFSTEFNVARSVLRKMAIGLNGAIYQQTTDDFQNGVRYLDGFRGRDFQIGPQVRFPLGEHGGFAFKYFRDTLVQNRPRGNAFWFQIAVPFTALSSGGQKH